MFMAELDYIVEPLRPLAIPLSQVVLDPKNTRKHGDTDLAELAEVLRTDGQDIPILVQKQGMVVRKGNGRVLAARRLGWSHIAAVVVDITDENGIRRAVVDNRIAERSTWDYVNLTEALSFLDESSVVLDNVGFDDDFVAHMLNQTDALARDFLDIPEVADGTAAPAHEPKISRSDAFKSDIVFSTQQDRSSWVRWTKGIRKKYGLSTLGDCLAQFVKDATL